MCTYGGCATGLSMCCRLPGTYNMLCRSTDPYCDAGLTCTTCTDMHFPMGSSCCL
jgi:hypothetical protein